jgi:hypothetical protein
LTKLLVIIIDSYFLSGIMFAVCYMCAAVVGVRLEWQVILRAIGWGAALIVAMAYALRLTGA